ncbi:MAG: prolyl oligopeptidase family serine peptidase, partial [Bacteroidota bacterium]|nr:prolyl oligopeptidase family serine peptidase [Bacteroidota bacterium]
MRKFLIVFLFAANNSFSQITINDLLSAPFPTELKSDLNGNTIAWVFNNKGSRNIYVAEAPDFSVKQITSYSGDDGIDITNLKFTPDGNKIVFVRGNSANGKGEFANPAQLQVTTERTVWIIDKNGNHLRKLGAGANPEIALDGKTLAFISGGQVWSVSLTDTTKAEKLFQARGSQADIRWAADNKLVFISNRGDHSFIAIYDLIKKSLSYPDPGVDLDFSPVLSPDGKFLAYIRVPNIHNQLPFTAVRTANPWSIRMINLQNGEVKELWKAAPGKGSAFFGDLPVDDNLLWWGSDNQLIFPYEKDGWLHLYALNILNGITRLLTPGSGEIENVELSNDRQTIYYTTNINDINRRHIWKLTIADAKTEQLTKENNIEWSPVITSNGISFLHSSATRPAWPATLINGNVADIGSELFPENFPESLVQPQVITITAKDGMKITTDLFLPPGSKAGEKHPALIFFHGGSRRQMLPGFHYSQYYSNAYALNQFFANKGYIVLAVNYRSGIGYGMEFREALNYGASGASEVNDVIAAGLYLRSRSDVIGNKIALWGGSYGGYLTAHGLARASDLFSCGVDI